MQKSHETIDRLFRSHHRDLITRARRVIGSGDAEDLVQEAYLKMLESDRGELISNARGYVSKMTCTLAIDNLRRQRTHARALAEDGAWFQSPARDTHITSAPDAFGLARDVQAALMQLPRCCRQIFFMSRILGFSHSEIAQEIGVSLRTVHRSLGRALDHFDRAFEVAPSSVPIESQSVKPQAAPSDALVEAAAPRLRNAPNIKISTARKNSRPKLSDFCGLARHTIRVPRSADPVWTFQTNSKGEAPMTIRIAKRITLNVIGRAGAMCASTCAATNG
ncbi:methanobactin precursor domain-containing sigma factor [Methylocystis sp.]|uniref:methanobactin precursor domain-containing sigma factor n=1 Tax=Methylocystis sp. TaxID=1911079 RepID=UPI0027342384|nr:methanobactin precursor domain-containing sigma factor [Methylocystis sp.]MDP3553856.1 methanobactin precursor domain-containing sigma factor [Methylocystis sp.]